MDGQPPVGSQPGAVAWRPAGGLAVEAFAGHTVLCLPRHAHAEYQVTLVESGRGAYHLGRGTHPVGAGALVAIDGDTWHDAASQGAEGWRFLTLHVHPSAVAGALGTGDGDGARRRPADAERLHSGVYASAVAVAAFGRLRRALVAAAPRLDLDVATVSALTVLFLRAAWRPAAEPPFAAAPGRIARAVEYLHAYPSRDVSLSELAAVAGLSPRHLVRAFASATGAPPHRYHGRLRLAHAARLLDDGWAPAAAGAGAGFADGSHFGRAFRRALGLTPGEYARARAAHGRSAPRVQALLPRGEGPR